VDQILPSSFFEAPALNVARRLLGQVLVHQHRRARIVEVEAYLGPHDLAAHSSKGRTARTEVMFGPAGRAYVFLVYGMHLCFNVVTRPGSAVLVRAVEPLTGIDERTDGPGRLTRALGITMKHNAVSLQGDTLYLVKGAAVARRKVQRGPRIGVDYAKHWAARPYRLWERENRFVSAR